MNETLELNGWTIAVQKPIHTPPVKTLLLLHGWTGNEQAMFPITFGYPKDWLYIAPRGPFSAYSNGYSWINAASHSEPLLDDYLTSVNALAAAIPEWLSILQVPLSPLSVMGFSQGGAMALLSIVQYPLRFARAACMSGFLPFGAESLFLHSELKEKPVFFSHGEADDIVPLERAKMAASYFTRAGANVCFCQDHSKHKLGLTCSKELKAFLLS